MKTMKVRETAQCYFLAMVALLAGTVAVAKGQVIDVPGSPYVYTPDGEMAIKLPGSPYVYPLQSGRDIAQPPPLPPLPPERFTRQPPRENAYNSPAGTGFRNAGAYKSRRSKSPASGKSGFQNTGAKYKSKKNR